MRRLGRVVLLILLLLEVGLLLGGDSRLLELMPQLSEHPALQWGVGILTVTGKADSLLILVLLLGVLRDRRAAQQALVTLLLTFALVAGLKLAVHRERPDRHDRLSFPSGDTAASAAAITPFLLANPRLSVIGIPWLAGVAGSRILTNRHYPSDVVAGLLIGPLLGWLVRRRNWLSRPRIGPRQMLFAIPAFPLGQGLVRLFGGAEHFLRFYPIFGLGLALLLLAASLRTFPEAVSRGMRQLERRAVIGLMVPVLFILVWVATGSTLWDRDEARFALSVREMVRSGNWLVPTLLGAVRPDKPILIYWLMAFFRQLPLPVELAMRGASLSAGMLTLFMTWRLAARRFGPTAALMTVTMLAGSPLFAVTVSQATADSLLLALLVASLGFLLPVGPEVAGFAGRYSGWRVLLPGMILGAALLTKGPPGLAIPVVGWLLARWLGRSRGDSLSARQLAAASAVAAGIYFLWAIPADRASGGILLSGFWGRHVLERFLSPLEGHGGSAPFYWLYYLPVIALGFFPWSFCLPGVIASLWKQRRRPLESRLLGWTISVVAIFTLAATKLPHYVLPAFPALALAAGPLLAARFQGAPIPFQKSGRLLTAALGYGGSLGLLLLPWLMPGLPALRDPLLGLALGLCLWTGLLTARETGMRTDYFLRFVGGLLVVAHGALVVIPALEAEKLGPRMAVAINGQPASRIVASLEFHEPSLHFYTGRPVTRLEDRNSLQEWLKDRDGGLLILPCTSSRRFPGFRWREMERVRGFNYVKGIRQELCLGELSGQVPGS